MIGLTDSTFKDTSFNQFPNATVEKHIDYSQLVTLFYNTQDKVLSDKKFRDALSYTLPDTIAQGERAASSLPPQSWAYRQNSLREQDTEHATLLLKDVKDQYKENIPTLTISTLPNYKDLAQIITKEWKKIGIKTKIKVVNNLPDQYQIFLGKFNVSHDPDQYSLWHSDQTNNITNYKNIRIDKLLEDGRKTLDQDQRIKFYEEFQKYLADDQPASFLYFPYVYSVSRK
jgi:peptide/nickel transport system substrate-binding protein